ncbi:fungal-specific transcription factor domain-containing protein [Mycena olivaceomarginata]|nr:fungal-specific transcription factor domain-containing protein [Mycena olivaceomarginata]
MMSSNDEEQHGQEFYRGTKRRLLRACDFCRRKKGDGSQLSGEKCTPCLEADVDCTYVEASVVHMRSYVDVATRLEHAEALVGKLRAELAKAHFASASGSNIPLPSISAFTAETDSAADPRAGTKPLDVPSAALCVMRATFQSLAAPPIAQHTDDTLDPNVAGEFQKLSVRRRNNPFFEERIEPGGALVEAALEMEPGAPSGGSAKENFPAQSPHDRTGDSGSTSNPDVGWTTRRLRYWTWKSRGDSTRHTLPPEFPSDALMSDLVELYFTRENIYLPVLHRPTFERGVAEGLHLRHAGFGRTVLLVCAIGSRWSTSPGMADNDSNLECGWEWFDQVSLVRNRLLALPTLYDLQTYCLAAQFLIAASLPRTWWNLVGVGLRLAQDLGVHRRKTRVETPSRAFWVLVYLDRFGSSVLGRTCSVGYFDYDLELPLEMDDEYLDWEHPTHPFQQPAHTPSRISFFNTLMRLSNILGFSLQILYSFKKLSAVLSINDAWEEQAIAELDSAINAWRDKIPDHLRWDPLREDPVFFNQSVALRCAYYHLQIMIHRPFIPMLRPAPTALPSLTICTSAGPGMRREGDIPRPLNLHIVFTSGLMLLLNILSSKRSGVLPDPAHDMVHVHKCMEVLRLSEGRWQSAGMLWDVLAELISVGQLPLPNIPAPTKSDWDYHQDTMNRSVKPAVSSSDTSSLFFDSFEFPNHPTQFHIPYPTGQSSLPGWVGMEPGIPNSSPFAPTAFAPRPDIPADAYTDPALASRELGTMMTSLGRDTNTTTAVWTNAPTGIQVDDWGSYYPIFADMMQGQGGPGKEWGESNRAMDQM